MARMKFLCDADRCIECNACVTACKNEHEVPWGINRRRVVTIGIVSMLRSALLDRNDRHVREIRAPVGRLLPVPEGSPVLAIAIMWCCLDDLAARQATTSSHVWNSGASAATPLLAPSIVLSRSV